jgi:hypothetical protein
MASRLQGLVSFFEYILIILRLWNRCDGINGGLVGRFYHYCLSPDHGGVRIGCADPGICLTIPFNLGEFQIPSFSMRVFGRTRNLFLRHFYYLLVVVN